MILRSTRIEISNVRGRGAFIATLPGALGFEELGGSEVTFRVLQGLEASGLGG